MLKRETVACPLCGSLRYALYERYGEELQYSYVRCTECRFIFQNPRFEYNENFLKWAYSWYGEAFVQDVAGKPYPSYEGNRYFAYKKKLIDRFVQQKPYRLLDVGSACGQFLSFCHGKNCEATGLEASAEQVAYARKHLSFETIQGTTSDLQGHADFFDVVHIAHTLEHVPNPLKVMEEIKRVTKPGGIIFVEVPNVFGMTNYRNHVLAKAKLKKNNWKKGDFPEHLIEFSPRTLKQLMKKTGLEMVYFQCHSRSALVKRPKISAVDFFLNRVVPYSDNLICLGTKVPSGN